MKKHMLLAAMSLGAFLFLSGCGGGVTIPPHLEVKDVSSGKVYKTYEPWGEVTKGVGYEFTDAETGRRITLRSYEVKTVEGQKTVPADSAEAKEFMASKALGGVK